MPGRGKPDVLCPGIVGMRGSMWSDALRPCMITTAHNDYILRVHRPRPTLPGLPPRHGVHLLQVKLVYTDVLSPFPKEIAQLDEQSVVFESTLLVVSPYKTTKQSTVVALASPKVRVSNRTVAYFFVSRSFVFRIWQYFRCIPSPPLRSGSSASARKAYDNMYQ